MKTVYFLRHGQTRLNRTWVHQFPDTRLSDKGRAQAAEVAEHFKNKKIDVIITSNLTRAEETAATIAQKNGAPFETSDLFVELRRPRSLWGISWAHPRSLWIMGCLYLNAAKEKWHHSDEENLEEFRARARRALELLADRPEQNILVVTHRGFIATLRERMMRDGLGTVGQYRRALWKNLEIGNCCYLTTSWIETGESDTSLDGTWTVDPKITCP